MATSLPTLYRHPIISVTLWVGLLYSALQAILYQFNIHVFASSMWLDYLAHLLIGIWLFLLAKTFWRWLIAYTLFIVILQICNALKLVILGSPIMPDDFTAVSNMFHLFGGWRLVVMWLMLVMPFMALLLAIDWSSKRACRVLFVTTLLFTCIFQWSQTTSEWLDDLIGGSVWNQPGNYKERGLLVHVLQESLRNHSRGKVDIAVSDAQAAFSKLSEDQALDNAALIKNPRNVYAILLESFWDPTSLKAAGIDQDPIDPRFRQLWKKTGYSKVMSPVFGGYTANSEFELLCGFPVSVDAVFFEGWLRNDAPCLPRYLANAGYQTIAAHPNYAAFWNRVNAYHRLGFTQYWAQEDFLLDDMNREFLSDASLYRQMWTKIQSDLINKKPIFAHIVTFFGHMDYPLNELRPKIIHVAHDPNMVEAYVNLMYYKSRELMDFVALLQKNDPTAIILMYGDHLPYLGPNYDGYVESGLLTRNKADFTPSMFRTYASTPLIIIDGENNTVRAGDLPIYQLPTLLLKLLGDNGNSFVSLATRTPQPIIRPLPGITLAVSNNQGPFTCVQQIHESSSDPRCESVNDWFNLVLTVAQDVFSGKQYSLQKNH